jgi:ribosomal protein S18 acetylase RimI-like enzyme
MSTARGVRAEALRPATDADVEALVALVQAAYRGVAASRRWTSEAEIVTGQRVDATMLSEALERSDTLVLVHEREGALLACCELRATGDATVELGMFAVDPARQAEGLGRQVLTAAEQTAGSALGARRIHLSVIHVRHELIDWYERRGYRRTGETRPFPYGDERFGTPVREDLRFEVLEKVLSA